MSSLFLIAVVFLVVNVGILSQRSLADDTNSGSADEFNRVAGSASNYVKQANIRPYMAQILNGENKLICSGSIIGNTTILSSAKCLTLFKDKATKLSVIVGSILREKVGGGKKLAFKKLTINDKFVKGESHDDLAILIVGDSLLKGDVAKNIEYGDLDKYKDGSRDSTAIGFGGKEEMLTELQNLGGSKGCTNYTKEGYTAKNQYCLALENKYVCPEDYGGPLVYIRKTDPKQVQIGIITLSKACDPEPTGQVPIIITKMNDVSSGWIKSHLPK